MTKVHSKASLFHTLLLKSLPFVTRNKSTKQVVWLMLYGRTRDYIKTTHPHFLPLLRNPNIHHTIAAIFHSRGSSGWWMESKYQGFVDNI